MRVASVKRLARCLRRWWWVLRAFRTFDADLKRRVRVENRLWAAVAGKKPPPTAEECRELALTLGVPDEYR